jgi:signal transduction histidine kinase
MNRPSYEQLEHRLGERTAELEASLDQQRATADVLKIISRSSSDVQRVFDLIAERATTLCGAKVGVVAKFDGALVHMMAFHGASPQAIEAIHENYPLKPGSETTTARAVRDGAPHQIADVLADPLYAQKDASRKAGFRSNLAVPMLRKGRVVGAITVAHAETGPFSATQVELLQTFADQAVIAIENARLFNETKEALEQQTATSEILRVIASSPRDVQPVFDTIVRNATSLCGAMFANVFRYDGELLHFVSTSNTNPQANQLDRETYPCRPSRALMSARAVLERSVARMEDALADPEYDHRYALAGWRRMLSVPMLREGRPIGAIVVGWAEPGPIAKAQEELLKTFADQAVIAVENVRLFNETREALEQQTATADVLRVISGSITDARPVFDIMSRSCLKLYRARHVSLFVRDADRIHRAGYAVAEPHGDDRSQELWPLPLDEKSLSGRAILRGELLHIEDAWTEAGLSEHSRAISRATGARSVLFAPMRSRGMTTGALSVARAEPGRYTDREIELLRTFADQAVIAMENVRLFRQIEEKGAQLEIANKHKSDFLANMSHELRTPLNAIIGFSEVLMERMFGELNAKQADYLKDIHESGRHLLSLINDILDLSKIEAGRMDLEISSFDLPSALSNAMTLVRERAQRHGIALGLELDPRLGEFSADERKMKQIVLNLLSNAVKFTPDGGRVDVSARLDTDQVQIAVKDTGIGIAPEDQAVVFEEFKQVGRDYTRKAEGTGLGLALTKRFVELHGGGIRLESAPGRGSTFTITLPVRQ